MLLLLFAWFADDCRTDDEMNVYTYTQDEVSITYPEA